MIVGGGVVPAMIPLPSWGALASRIKRGFELRSCYIIYSAYDFESCYTLSSIPDSFWASSS